MTKIEQQAEIVLDLLNKSVQEALDKKKRLGQYAVIWRNERVERLFDDDKSSEQKK